MRSVSPVLTVVELLPVGLAVLVFSPVSGRLVGWIGTRPSLVTAGLLIAAMSTMLIFLTPMAPQWLLMAIFVAFGITFGMVTVPINYAAVSGMPQDRAGAAAGITSTSKQIGISVGVALSGVLATGALSPPMGDFTESADPLWAFTLALGLAIAGLGIASTSPRAQRSAERLAPLLAVPQATHYILDALIWRLQTRGTDWKRVLFAQEQGRS